MANIREWYRLKYQGVAAMQTTRRRNKKPTPLCEPAAVRGCGEENKKEPFPVSWLVCELGDKKS